MKGVRIGFSPLVEGKMRSMYVFHKEDNMKFP